MNRDCEMLFNILSRRGILATERIDEALAYMETIGSGEETDDETGIEGRLGSVEKSVRRSAQADLVRAIIDCERLLVEIQGYEIKSELEAQAALSSKDRVSRYLDKLIELELDLAVLARFHFDEGEVCFYVKPGTVATLIQIEHRAKGLPSDSHSGLVAIWIPTNQVKELKDKL